MSSAACGLIFVVHAWYAAGCGQLSKVLCVVRAQLSNLKEKLTWKGVGKRAVKELTQPGEPGVNPAAVPQHGGVC